ncbi:MAG TPA: hypothetical protein VLV87_01445 [Gammaproteobacteria bacterium]|nr:hypothetical protein [Gammaproteobacteria bacterium]
MAALADWDSFYVIVGSAAGALIGLQFVVMTLIAVDPPKGVAEAGAAFSTPTVVHFTAVLMLAALVRIPWASIEPASVLFGLIGIFGTVYALSVARRMHTQTAYTPVLEDWMFHALLPVVAYVTVAVSAFAAPSDTHGALFGVGAAVLVLLFTGIHNAWDAVAYHVVVNLGGKKGKRR